MRGAQMTVPHPVTTGADQVCKVCRKSPSVDRSRCAPCRRAEIQSNNGTRAKALKRKR